MAQPVHQQEALSAAVANTPAAEVACSAAHMVMQPLLPLLLLRDVSSRAPVSQLLVRPVALVQRRFRVRSLLR